MKVKLGLIIGLVMSFQALAADTLKCEFKVRYNWEENRVSGLTYLHLLPEVEFKAQRNGTKKARIEQMISDLNGKALFKVKATGLQSRNNRQKFFIQGDITAVDSKLKVSSMAHIRKNDRPSFMKLFGHYPNAIEASYSDNRTFSSVVDVKVTTSELVCSVEGK